MQPSSPTPPSPLPAASAAASAIIGFLGSVAELVEDGTLILLILTTAGLLSGVAVLQWYPWIKAHADYRARVLPPPPDA